MQSLRATYCALQHHHFTMMMTMITMTMITIQQVRACTQRTLITVSFCCVVTFRMT